MSTLPKILNKWLFFEINRIIHQAIVEDFIWTVLNEDLRVGLTINNKRSYVNEFSSGYRTKLHIYFNNQVNVWSRFSFVPWGKIDLEKEYKLALPIHGCTVAREPFERDWERDVRAVMPRVVSSERQHARLKSRKRETACSLSWWEKK